MSGFRANDPLMGPQRRRNHRQIGLSSSHQKMDGQSFILAELTDFFRGPGTVGIHAVAGGLLQVGAGHGLQNFGMAALTVIIVEINHFRHLVSFPLF